MNAQLTAHYLANRYPERVIEIRNCDHEGAKVKHHPDYSRPYEVELLCSKCHGEKRLATINMPKIERERERAGLSCYALAKRIGMTPQGYHSFKIRKSTSLATLSRIAEALGCDAKDLLRE